MSIASVTNQRERDKFEENSEGNTAVRSIIDPDQITALTPPTGFATSAKQDVGNVSIESVNSIISDAVDSTTDAIVVMDYPHHEVHAGCHFYLEGHTTLANEGVYRVKLVTPNTTKWGHLRWSISSSGILETTLHEGASGGMADGSSVTPLNNNRNSSVSSGMTITAGVGAAVSAGTLISNAKWGADGFKSSIGGGSSRADEFILKQNTTYLRTFTSSTAANIIQFKAGWYEHTNK